MATIVRHPGRNGQTSYRAQVRHKGTPALSASFAKLSDARKWVQVTEAAIEYDNDESRADLAFCNMLVAGGAQTIAECLAVIGLSGLYDKKWDRDDYQEQTIGKALEAKGSAAKTPEHAPTVTRLIVQSAQALANANYDALAPLQSFALSHGIGLVVVTRTNQKDVFTPTTSL
jgi:hypothetical protein